VVNSLQFWPSLQDGLREVYRVLEPGGRLVVALRTRVAGTSQFDRRRFGLTDERVNEVVAMLTVLGFRAVATQRREVRGEAITAIVGNK
jgi:ubiquinone/menaquinone biosynthesis C-methylase UbiE